MQFIPVAEPDLSGNEEKYVRECVQSTWISSLGKYIPEFEEKFASFCDAKHGISVANGTVALHLALYALNIGPGDEVIIPDMTFVATANAVRYVGATPVLADVDPDYWTLDPAQVEKKITAKTKAIIPVHLYGHPCDMDPLLALAKKHDLKIIEDAAEAHGARYKGRRVGSIGDVGCFSFYGNKIITTGEGGMCTTNDDALAARLAFLKDHGMSAEKRYFHPELGFNFRMTNIQAAIGLAQLERVDEILATRAQHAALYREFLHDSVQMQKQAPFAEMVHWFHSALVPNRDELIAKLKHASIDSRPFFYAMHQLPMYEGKDAHFPVSTKLAAQGISFPSSTRLSAQDIKRVCETILS